jgi:hypothetical protein
MHEAPELAGHATQVSAAVAPTVVEYVPAPQLVHAAEPLASLYVPVAHGAQLLTSGPVYPALQAGLIQAALDVLAMGEF